MRIASSPAVRIIAGVLVAVSLGAVGYRIVHRRKPDSPEALLERADKMSWLNSWIAAAPLYRQAELQFTQEHQLSKALYARVSQMPAHSESTTTLPSQIATLRHDLNLPEAHDPETRLRILTVLGMLEVTETDFKRLPLSRFNVIHLALHGYANSEFPDRSALVFAPENPPLDDGLLQVREIRRLPLNASLVTLSACDTGVGPVGEEGVANIVNAFIEAGAQSVVSTLWEIEDRATAKFMIDFYRQLGKGAGKAKALRQAQLDMLHSGASPYYWAGFELVGEPSGSLFNGPGGEISFRSGR